MNPALAKLRAKKVLAEAREAHLAGDYARSGRLAYDLVKLGEPAAAAYHNYYYHYRITRDLMTAETLMRHAINLGIDTATAYFNLGCVLRDQTKTEEAQAAFYRALELQPAFIEALNGYGSVAWELGEEDDALRAWHRALVIEPAEPAARNDLALQQLMLGDYANGWRNHRARWDAPLFKIDHKRPEGPEWDGAPVNTLLLFAEQGHGDALMLLRWVPWARARCERLHLAIHGPLVQLVRANFPDVVVQKLEEPAPAYHAFASLFDLPAIANIQQPEHVRVARPYLRAACAALPRGRHRVGLVWAGGLGTRHDWRRSMPFEAVRPLLDVPVGWHVMQLERLEDFDAAGLKTVVWHRDIAPLRNFADTARALMSLNLLITVDTAIAHLAGALGVPTWLLLPRYPDYRWGLRGDTTPWYDSVRLFRQPRAHDWAPVVADVQAALMEWRGLNEEGKAA